MSSISHLYRQGISLIDSYDSQVYLFCKNILTLELQQKSFLEIKTHTLQVFDIYDGDWSINLKLTGTYTSEIESLFKKKNNLLEMGIKLELEILTLKLDNIESSYYEYYEREKSNHDFWFHATKVEKRNIGVLDEHGKEINFVKDFIPKYTKSEFTSILKEQLHFLKDRNYKELEKLSKKYSLSLLTFGFHPIYGDRLNLKDKLNEENFKKEFFEEFSNILYLDSIYISTKEGVRQDYSQLKKIKKPEDCFKEDIRYLKEYLKLVKEDKSDRYYLRFKDSNRSTIILKKSSAKSLVRFAIESLKEKYDLTETTDELLSKISINLSVTFNNYLMN